MSRKEFDCVEIKREAQRPLRAALAGKSPDEQAAEIARRGARNPLWQELVRGPKPAPAGRRRTAGRR
jgi:hypothetical protein